MPTGEEAGTMLNNSMLNEMTSKYIMQDRLREAEQYRLLKRSEEARRSQPKRGLLRAFRQALALRRTIVRPTTAAGSGC